MHIILYLKMLLFIVTVLGQDNYLMGSRTSSTWLNSELTPDEDSSGLDYMLALSLQTDGEFLPGNGDGTQWSRMWDYNQRMSNMPSFTSPPNNNYPNLTTGTNALVEDLHQTGKCCNSFTSTILQVSLLFSMYMSLFFSRNHAAL